MESQDRCESYSINISVEDELNYFQKEEIIYSRQHCHRQSLTDVGDAMLNSSEFNTHSKSLSTVPSNDDQEDCEDDLEADAIVAKQITVQVLNNLTEIIDPIYLKHYSKLAYKPYVYSEHLKKFFSCSLQTVDETDTTILRVQHKKQDHELGDDFGANISSTPYMIKGNHYLKHEFRNIKPDTVASDIKLVDADELVLLNSQFMPHLSHQEVVDMIRHLPVDLGERISLVIRRSGRDKPWFIISALLVSSPGKDPIAENIQSTFEAYPPTTPISSLLQLQNRDGVYMLIENHQIGTWTLLNNTLDKKAVVSLDCTVTVGKTGYVEFVATIEKDENGYIFVDSNNSVRLNDEMAYKFIYKTTDGGKCMFQHKESGMYLGYQGSNVCLVNYEYKFVRNPPKNYDDRGAGNSSTSNISLSG